MSVTREAFQPSVQHAAACRKFDGPPRLGMPKQGLTRGMGSWKWGSRCLCIVYLNRLGKRIILCTQESSLDSRLFPRALTYTLVGFFRLSFGAFVGRIRTARCVNKQIPEFRFGHRGAERLSGIAAQSAFRVLETALRAMYKPTRSRFGAKTHFEIGGSGRRMRASRYCYAPGVETPA